MESKLGKVKIRHKETCYKEKDRVVEIYSL